MSAKWTKPRNTIPAILANIEPPPFDRCCLMPLPKYLRVIAADWSRQPGPNGEGIDGARARVLAQSVYEEIARTSMGNHMDCYRKGAFLMLSGRADDEPVHFEPGFCTQAGALTLWWCRVESECSLIGARAQSSALGEARWRASLTDSFRYCLESMEILHALFMSRDDDGIVAALNAGALRVYRDPWMSGGAHLNDGQSYTDISHTITLLPDHGHHHCDDMLIYNDHLARVREEGERRFARLKSKRRVTHAPRARR
jgi:hypothetical protein